MKRSLLAFVFLVLTAGCAKTGDVVVVQPVAHVPNDKVVAVAVRAPDDSYKVDSDRLRDGLLAEFADRKWWHPGAQPDATFEITITSFEKGNKAERIFLGGGEAEMHCDVVLRAADGNVIGKLAVVGNSKRNTHVRVGGYDTSWGDDLPGRAVKAAIEQIVDYLDDHR